MLCVIFDPSYFNCPRLTNTQYTLNFIFEKESWLTKKIIIVQQLMENSKHKEERGKKTFL
jgi:hypothetical protein